jgi:nicotinamidase-related amidase
MDGGIGGMRRGKSNGKKDLTRHPILASPENVGLVVVDVQEKFAPVLPEFDRIVKSIIALVKGFLEFGLPVIRTEQYPAGLGKTVPAISDCLRETRTSIAVEKMTFSAMQAREFTDRIKALEVASFVVCGIETHICVHQTVCDMLHAGYGIWVPWDAVGSRDPKTRDVALGRMEKAGAILSSTEMLLFEMAMRAGTESFKKIQSWIK